METTAGLSSSSRSTDHLDRISNCRLKWEVSRGKTWCQNFENRKIGDVFAYGTTTISAMVKWMLPLELTRPIGLETVLTDILIPGNTEEGKGIATIWKSEFWNCFCLRSHNQGTYVKSEGTSGFSSSNWSRNRLDGISNSRLTRLHKGKGPRWLFLQVNPMTQPESDPNPDFICSDGVQTRQTHRTRVVFGFCLLKNWSGSGQD